MAGFGGIGVEKYRKTGRGASKRTLARNGGDEGAEAGTGLLFPISLQFQRRWVETVDCMDRRRREEEKKHGAVLGKTPSSRSADNSVGAAARDETTFQR